MNSKNKLNQINPNYLKNSENTQELVLLNDDKILEYKEKTKTEITLFEKLLKSNEFCRAPTKETVLDEDDYLSFMEEIITRDYFPDLYELKKQNIKVNNY